MNTSDRKKQRGQRRKLDAIRKNMDYFTPFQNLSSAYEHFHVPGSMFLQHPKTAGKVKTDFCREWIRKTEQIMEQKPAGLSFCKVVSVIDIPNLWDSQIIIFYDKEYYDTFFDRRGPEQVWEPLGDDELSFVKERNIETDLLEKGYAETICEEGGYSGHSVLWFYGDLSCSF